MAKTAGQIIVKTLEQYGVDRIFCVPGESFLPILDALHDSPIQTILARHEGGAAMMAEADGKMTHRPGIALVTRGPGASNAAAGVHIAQQDSTPMMLLIGQVARDMRGRDAFQEVDYHRFYGGMAKRVFEIDDANDVPEILAEAWRIALEGRRGPVVISLPEDMLYDAVAADARALPAPAPAPDMCAELDALAVRINQAANPVLIVGGSAWSDAAIARLEQFAIHADIPVFVSFRRQRLMCSLSPAYGGDLGLGCNPAILERIRASDLVILFGGRMSEVPSQSYQLFSLPKPQMPFVHIHRDAGEIGRVYTPDLGFVMDDEESLLAGLLARIDAAEATKRIDAAHAEYQNWTTPLITETDTTNMSHIVGWLRDHLPPEAIMTNGAGNYATWLHRFYHFRSPQSQLAPVSGSMGYGIPAAVAASLRYPDRPVIAFAGDGCFQMTMQELATAQQFGATPIIIVVDNGQYGTIRMHQTRHFPGRGAHLTKLINPDFCALAEAMGALTFHVKHASVGQDNEFAEAMQSALTANRLALIHLPITEKW